MEENEVIYIPYGLDEIDYKQFQLNLANNYLEYLKGRRWAKKLKNVDAWMKAYNNILKQGITGASVENGQWSINHNGENFEYANPLEKSMYEDVASYLVGLMKAMPKRKKEEEKKKTSYDYKTFLQGLLDYIGRELFGGQPDYISKWTDYDELPKNGLRGTVKRQAAMAELLKGYKDYINQHKDEYDFKSYNGIDNWNNRVDRALVALNNPEWNDEDKHSLDALGLNYNTWFNNGGSDPLIVGNQQMTRELYVNEYLPQLEKLKKEAEIKTLQAELKKINDNKYKNFRFFNASKLAGTPPTGNDSLLKLNSYASLPLLNGQLLSELIGAFKFAAKNGILQNISKEELQKFGPRWSENRLKKINGLNGFYWDSIGNRVVQPFLNEIPQVGFLDLVNLNRPKTPLELQAEQLITPRGKGTELTWADKRDIAATIADLGAFITPGLVSGTTAALSASGLRTWNSLEERGLWNTLTDWKTWADWGTGALGGTALLGDASSIAKFARGLGKIMTIPAMGNAIANAPEAKAAWDKIDPNNITESIKKLTPQDYHALSSFLIGILSGKNYLKGNLAERKVIEHSGYTPELINASKGKIRQYVEKHGILRTKVPKGEVQSQTSYIKAKVNGTDKEIEISPEVKSQIEKAVNKAGNKESDRNNAIEKILKDKKLIKNSDKVTVQAPKKYSDNKYNPARYFTRTTDELFTTKTNSSQIQRGEGDFENWLSTRSNWDKWRYGTNKNLRRIHDKLGMTSGQLVTQLQLNNPQLQNNPLQQLNNPSQNNLKALPFHTNKKIDVQRIRKYQENFKKGKGANSSEDLTFNVDETTGALDLGKGNSLSYFKLDNGKYEAVWEIGGKQESKNFNSIKELKERMAKLANDLTLGLYGKIDTKEVAQALRNMEAFKLIKANKQGGTIDKQKIQKYIEFIKK